KAMAELAKGGPIAGQAESVSRLLHSDQTMIHLVTLLEALPVQETLDAVAELSANDLRIGSVIVNRAAQSPLSMETRAAAAAGELDTEAVRAGLEAAGIALTTADFAGLLTETVEHSTVLSAQDQSAEDLLDLDIARLQLPTLDEGMDLGGLYELASYLTEQGVRGAADRPAQPPRTSPASPPTPPPGPGGGAVPEAGA